MIDKTLLIFDIDGTLCDTKVVGDNCFIETFETLHRCNLQNIKWEKFKNVTDTALYAGLVALNTNINDYKMSLNEFRYTYQNNLSQTLSNQKVNVVNGVTVFIQELKNKQIDIAIATGNWKEIAELKMRHCGFNFENVPLSTSNDAFKREEIIKAVIEKSKIFYNKSHYKKVVYFGDGLWDYQCSRNLNIEFIGVDIDNNKKLTKTDTKLIINDFLDTDIILKYIQSV